jgi:hypothetical protein
MAWVSSVDQRVRELAGGMERFEVPAGTVRALLTALEARHPGLGEHVRESMAIAIDGENRIAPRSLRSFRRQMSISFGCTNSISPIHRACRCRKS